MTENTVIKPGTEFYVLVHRYDPDVYGLHHLWPDDVNRPWNMFAYPWSRAYPNHREGPRYQWRTIGLFKMGTEEPLAIKIRDMERLPVPDEVKHWVYRSVTPIEWHYQLFNGDPEITRRVEILIPDPAGRHRRPVHA